MTSDPRTSALICCAVPELPDIVIYIEALEQRVLDHALQRIHLASPFLLRTATPQISEAEAKQVVELRRLGKRICIGLEDELWLVLHLMIAGRLHWKDVSVSEARPSGRAPLRMKPSKNQLAVFEFDNGTLSLTEAGTQRRASLHLVKGEAGLRALDPGGVEVLDIGLARFAAALQAENHTLKRSLTDPHTFSGIGNAYSDEILWAAQLSPVKLTQKLSREEVERLYDATRKTLVQWVERLREETGEKFPEGVTAFRNQMAVHGRYKQNCPHCGAKVQRIRYATKRTIAQPAKPAASCSRTARSREFCATTGQRLRKNSDRSMDVGSEHLIRLSPMRETDERLARKGFSKAEQATLPLLSFLRAAGFCSCLSV